MQSWGRTPLPGRPQSLGLRCPAQTSPVESQRRGTHYDSSSTEEETKAQRGEGTCPRSCRQEGKPDSRPCLVMCPNPCPGDLPVRAGSSPPGERKAQHSQSPLLPEAEAMWGPFTFQGGPAPTPSRLPDSCGGQLARLRRLQGPSCQHRDKCERLGILLLTSDHHPHRQGAPHQATAALDGGFWESLAHPPGIL